MSIDTQNQSKSSSLAKDHLANERTFLAWIRTSIGIMAFGFVVEKFALFMKRLSLLLVNEQTPIQINRSEILQGYSSTFGVVLVAFGVLISIFAYIKFKKNEKWIDDATYHPTTLLDAILTLAVLVIGIFLIFYLRNNI